MSIEDLIFDSIKQNRSCLLIVYPGIKIDDSTFDLIKQRLLGIEGLTVNANINSISHRQVVILNWLKTPEKQLIRAMLTKRFVERNIQRNKTIFILIGSWDLLTHLTDRDFNIEVFQRIIILPEQNYDGRRMIRERLAFLDKSEWTLLSKVASGDNPKGEDEIRLANWLVNIGLFVNNGNQRGFRISPNSLNDILKANISKSSKSSVKNKLLTIFPIILYLVGISILIKFSISTDVIDFTMTFLTICGIVIIFFPFLVYLYRKGNVIELGIPFFTKIIFTLQQFVDYFLIPIKRLTRYYNLAFFNQNPERFLWLLISFLITILWISSSYPLLREKIKPWTSDRISIIGANPRWDGFEVKVDRAYLASKNETDQNIDIRGSNSKDMLLRIESSDTNYIHSFTPATSCEPNLARMNVDGQLTYKINKNQNCYIYIQQTKEAILLNTYPVPLPIIISIKSLNDQEYEKIWPTTNLDSFIYRAPFPFLRILYPDKWESTTEKVKNFFWFYNVIFIFDTLIIFFVSIIIFYISYDRERRSITLYWIPSNETFNFLPSSDRTKIREIWQNAYFQRNSDEKS